MAPIPSSGGWSEFDIAQHDLKRAEQSLLACARVCRSVCPQVPKIAEHSYNAKECERSVYDQFAWEAEGGGGTCSCPCIFPAHFITKILCFWQENETVYRCNLGRQLFS